MNTQRMLAYGVAESIYHMTGRVPRRTCLRCQVLAWTVVCGLIATVLIASTATH